MPDTVCVLYLKTHCFLIGHYHRELISEWLKNIIEIQRKTVCGRGFGLLLLLHIRKQPVFTKVQKEMTKFFTAMTLTHGLTELHYTLKLSLGVGLCESQAEKSRMQKHDFSFRVLLFCVLSAGGAKEYR